MSSSGAVTGDYFGGEYLTSEGFRIPDEISMAECELLSALAPPGSRVLDVGFGHGRHLAELRRQGLDIYGIESSPGCLSHVQARHPELRSRLELGDAQRHRHESGPFALIYGMYNSFFYGPETTSPLDALRHITASLENSGTLVLEYLRGDRLSALFRQDTRSWWGRERPKALATLTGFIGNESDYARAHLSTTGILTQKRIFWKERRRSTYVVKVQTFTPAAITALCAQTGLAVIDTKDSLHSPQLSMVVAQKAAT